jgi:type III pantothenate kinase
MHLLVDVGNTSIKWAMQAAAAAELKGFGAAMHGGALPLDLLAAWDALEGIEGVVAAGVGPRTVKDAVVRVCGARFDCTPRWVETRAEAQGMRIAYAAPERLGVDRFLALIAAYRLAHADAAAGPTLIVDAGTAVTYDLLAADGQHLGGLILPGVRIMRDSLLAGTQIPCHEPADADRHWAADTGEAIAAASLHAPAALAERLHRRLAAETGLVPRCLFTGGDAERIAAVTELPAEHIPDLVLRGLATFAAD